MALLPELVMVAFASQEVFTHQSRSWKDFATKNASRIEKGTGMTGPQAKLLAAINRTTHK